MITRSMSDSYQPLSTPITLSLPESYDHGNSGWVEPHRAGSPAHGATIGARFAAGHVPRRGTPDDLPVPESRAVGFQGHPVPALAQRLDDVVWVPVLQSQVKPGVPVPPGQFQGRLRVGPAV